MRFTLAMAGASAAILGTLGMGLPSQALAEPVVLEPQSPWSMDFGDTRCRLARLFGEEDDKHIVIFDQFGPGDSFLLTLAGSSVGHFDGGSPILTSFNSKQEPFEGELYTGALGSYGKALVFRKLGLSATVTKATTEPPSISETPSSPALRRLDIEAAKATEFFQVDQGEQIVRLKIGSLGDAFTLLNQCTHGLIESWGLDSAAHLTAQRWPELLNEERVAKGVLGSYPIGALRRGESGVVELRVAVSKAGSVTNCVVENTTASSELQSAACRGMRRSRFNPALDAEGNPMDSFYRTEVTYSLP